MSGETRRGSTTDRIIDEYLKMQARHGRAADAHENPETGSAIIDRLKELGDALTSTNQIAEAYAESFAKGAFVDALDIELEKVIKKLERELGRGLTDDEKSALETAGVQTFVTATKDDRSDKAALNAGGSALDGLSFPAKRPGEGAAPDDGLREEQSLFDLIKSRLQDFFERDDVEPQAEAPRETRTRDADDGAWDAPQAPEPPAEERGSAPQSDAGGRDRESAAFARTAEATLGAVEETEAILLTPLDRWPEADMRRLLSDPGYWGADRALRDGYRDRVALWHGLTYGTDPVRRDATGRMVEPAPKRPPPAARPALAGADGEPFGHAVRALSQFLGAPSRRAGPTQAVQSLQRGLNRLSSAEARPARARDPYKASDAPDALAPGGAVGADRPLKEDGVLGPKTAAATRRAIARRGRPAVEAAARAAAGSSPPLSASASAQGRAPRDRFGRPKLLA